MFIQQKQKWIRQFFMISLFVTDNTEALQSYSELFIMIPTIRGLTIDRLPAMCHFMKKCGQDGPQRPRKMRSIDIDVFFYTEGISAGGILTKVGDFCFRKRYNRDWYGLIFKKCNIEKIDPPIKLTGQILQSKPSMDFSFSMMALFLDSSDIFLISPPIK